jgi:hypothetical protein
LASIDTLPQCVPLFWNIAFKNLKAADLNDRVSTIRIVHVTGEKPFLTTVYNYSAYVGYSAVVFKVPVEYQKPMAPRCTHLVTVQLGNGLDFAVLLADCIVFRVRQWLSGND